MASYKINAYTEIGNTNRNLKSLIPRYIAVRATVNKVAGSVNTITIDFDTVDVNNSDGLLTLSPGGFVVADSSVKHVKVTLIAWVERGADSYAWCRIGTCNMAATSANVQISEMIPKNNGGDVWHSITMSGILNITEAQPVIYPTVYFTVLNEINGVKGGTYANTVKMLVEILD